MSGKHESGGVHKPNPRELLDAYFDGDLDRAGKAKLHEALREDHLLAEEFSRTSEAVSMLRQCGSNNGLSVDLTDRVLARCEVRRGYLNRRGRRFVLAGRSAVVMAAMAIVAGVAVWIRLTPPDLRLPDSQRPLGVLLESGNSDAADLRMVPPSVQRDLADSVDQNKVERTIVYGLPTDSPESFSTFGRGATGLDTAATARLPLVARSADPLRRGAMAWRAEPLPMDPQRAASYVPQPGDIDWWNRSEPTAGARPMPGRARGHWLLLRRGHDPTLADLIQAERDRE
ncbi:MAG: hypothetical protein ACIAS6_12500 [Phycisphaerales bacterium JB060]